MIKRNICLFLSTLCFSVSMPQAWAQSTFRASSADDVAMIFYKTGNSVPNFTKWVERTEEFNHTPWALREKK